MIPVVAVELQHIVEHAVALVVLVVDLQLKQSLAHFHHVLFQESHAALPTKRVHIKERFNVYHW